MNGTPTTTGAIAISGAMLGGVITWACQAAHITPPPIEVAGTLGAVILSLGHAFLSRGGAK